MGRNFDDADFAPIAVKSSQPRHSSPPGWLGIAIGGVGVWIWWAPGSGLGLFGSASLGLGWLARAVTRRRHDWGAAGFVLVAACIPLGAAIGHFGVGLDGELLGVAGFVLSYPTLLGCGLSWLDDVRRQPERSRVVEFLIMAVTILPGILVALILVVAALYASSFLLGDPPRC